MSLYPDLQEKLYQEALEHIGHKKAPKSDDIMKMPLFNAFLHEVLRHVSLIPQGLSHCPTEPIKLAGYDIPAGTQIYLNQYAIRKLRIDVSLSPCPYLLFRSRSKVLEVSGHFQRQQLP